MASGEDESDLFRRAMRDVKPLKQRTPRIRSEKIAPSRTSGTAETVTTKRTLRSRSAAPAATFPKSKAPTLQRGDMAGLDRRTGQRFKRGQLPVEARLDLHGMYQDAAHIALVQFVTESAAQGRRCVLVITGRGSREGSGVLRARLPEWLNQLPCRPHVLGFTAARPEHGRDGAFYVLLRRKREDRI